MIQRSILKTALVITVVIIAATGVGFAQATNCQRVGTWFGTGDSGMTWIDIATRGASATGGQLDLDWVLLDPTLGGFFPTAVRVTPGKGVWEHVNRQTYKYTWVAYAFDGSGSPVFMAKTSGFIKMADCNTINIAYTLELFAPGQNIWEDTPTFGAFTGTGLETRMPLVVTQ